MLEKIGIQISEDLKKQIFAFCPRGTVSAETCKMLEEFKLGKIHIPLAQIPPMNLCNTRLDLTLPIGLMDAVWVYNDREVQRTNRWVITRLWQMRLNGEI